MDGIFEYRGHRVSVSTQRAHDGLHGWVCLLNESSVLTSSPESRNEERVAFIAAIAYACHHLDTLSDPPRLAPC